MGVRAERGSSPRLMIFNFFLASIAGFAGLDPDGFGFVSSRFGSSTVRTPFANEAAIFSWSTFAGIVNERTNFP